MAPIGKPMADLPGCRPVTNACLVNARSSAFVCLPTHPADSAVWEARVTRNESQRTGLFDLLSRLCSGLTSSHVAAAIAVVIGSYGSLYSRHLRVGGGRGDGGWHRTVATTTSSVGRCRRQQQTDECGRKGGCTNWPRWVNPQTFGTTRQRQDRLWGRRRCSRGPFQEYFIITLSWPSIILR